MEENRMNPPSPDAGLCGSDREIFARVWRRVMPTASQTCPIELEQQPQVQTMPSQPQAVTPMLPATSPMPQAVSPMPQPQAIADGVYVQETQTTPGCSSNALVMSPSQTQTVNASEVAPRRDVSCLGRSSAVNAALLREMIDGETEDWRIYQALARRLSGSGSKTLGSLAADERRHARRLSTAYFLITGQRYQPQGQGGSRPVPDLMNGLREQYLQEQRECSAYQGAAAETGDECLSALFLELSEDKTLHCQTIRALLEQLS